VAHVGVNDADDGRSRRFEAFDDRSPEAELAGPVQHGDPMTPGEVVREGARSVRRVVVHDDELTVEPLGRIRTKDRPDQIGEAVAFVVSGNDDGDGGWARGGAQGSDSQAL
jgi:hypothetical protein